jgi:UDP-N-acetylglucosamine diphosphorylase/glucosamine-1-phosphate N-acetyltransferase
VSPAIVLYDDAIARAFEPFALTRPVSELRGGATLMRERWERVCDAPATGFVASPHLKRFRDFASPAAVDGALAAGTLLVNARFAPSLAASIDLASATRVWTHGGRVVAVRLERAIDHATLADGGVSLDALASDAGARIDGATTDGATTDGATTDGATTDGATTDGATTDGWWIDEVWDFTRHLVAMLGADIPVLARTIDRDDASPIATLGEHEAIIERGAYIEPFVIADTTVGPVLVRRGARIAAFSRLVGPCVIGEDVQVGGGKISMCSIGEQSRVHGELSMTIFTGHANKGHDGFVGHSILGRWVNLGAGTITSNLKNSYGEVSLWTPTGVRPTGLQFLGTMLGDHAKTGIGTRFTTGSVIGAGANIFGTAIPPKVVPPFAWGDTPPFDVFALDKCLAVAERVMSRRGVPLDDAMRAVLTAAWTQRTKFGA